MPLFSFLFSEKKNSSGTAKGRLQLILAHDRSGKFSSDFFPQLQNELISVIMKYIEIKPDDIKINLEKQDALEFFEVRIEIPQSTQTYK
ncbi:MAG: cell division topological specificity factor MinE [Bordetella sp.]|nr:MAG: cell division topological specificity factor MinE [Bordetella sp.]